MTSQPGQQIIKIHILRNNSQNKDNHTMKFGKIIKCNKKNVLQKSCGKCGGETCSRPLFVFQKSFI